MPPPTPRRSRSRSRSPSDPPEPLIEFRAIEDDAWYSCSTRIEEDGGCYVDKEKEGLETYLRIMYTGLPKELDQRFPAGMFADAAEIEVFRDRFRPLSKQLQDWECRDVAKGTKVCASSVLKGTAKDDDLKFFDAVVESVNHSNHKFDNKKEVCTCKFVLLWIHGPNKGSLTPRAVENICIVQEKREPCDLAVDFFLDMAMKKLSLRKLGFCTNISPRFEHGSHDLANGNNQVLGDVSTEQRYDGLACDLMQITARHVDLGGSANLWEPIASDKQGLYFIVVENMEKSILPESIVDFIQRETSLHIEAIVFPSFYSESCSRGLILADTREKMVKVVEFLGNSYQLIVSSKGRPWVIPERKFSYGSMACSLSKFQIHSRINSDESRNDTHLVRKGSKEFEKAEQLHDVFLEFHKHVQGLHRALKVKERMIFQS